MCFNLDGQLKVLENQISNAVYDALNTGHIANTNSEKISEMYFQFREHIKKEEDVTPELIKLSSNIKSTLKRLDILFEESVKLFNEIYDSAINNGSQNTEVINQLRFLQTNLENIIKIDERQNEDKKRILDDIKSKMQILYNITFFFNR